MGGFGGFDDDFFGNEDFMGGMGMNFGGMGFGGMNMGGMGMSGGM